MAASSQQAGGIANIALLKSDGNNYREVTGGDTVDTAPAWLPGVPDRLLFQSQGLARNEQGYIVAQGHATIQKLDMTSSAVTPILDDARFDHLKPRVSPKGDLLFIRRPYEAPRYGFAAVLIDTLLFPFRLLRAVFHYLNFSSLMYSRKPLTSASGPAVQADMKNILLQGRRIDAEKARRLAAMDYLDIQISLDGVDAATNDAVRGIGSYDMARRAMDNLAAANFGPFKISVVVTRQNVPQLDAFKALADSYGAQLRARVPAGTIVCCMRDDRPISISNAQFGRRSRSCPNGPDATPRARRWGWCGAPTIPTGRPPWRPARPGPDGGARNERCGRS